MFDSVGDALDELRSLRKKKTDLINKHIARFKMLATESKIDTMNPLSIKLFKETLPWALTVQLMKLETPLKTIDDWYKWAATLNHRHHKLNRAIEWTRGTSEKEKTPQRKYHFSCREMDPNAMDIDRLTIDKWNRKEGASSVITPDTRLTNALKMKMTRRKRLKKSLERRWTDENSMCTYKPCSRIWQKKIEMSLWKVPKKRVFKKENYLDVSISLSWCSLCNNSEYFIKSHFCPHQYLLKWTNYWNPHW
jgi:hypothetical protein